MKRHPVALVAMLCFAACKGQEQAPTEPDPASSASLTQPETESPAIVNGEALSLSELNSRFARSWRRSRSIGSDESNAYRVKRALIEEMIDETLIRQSAARRGVVASASEVDIGMEALAATFPSRASFEQFRAGAAGQGLRASKELEVLTRKLMGPETDVTDADVVAFYERNRVRFDRQACIHGNEIVLLAKQGEPADSREPELLAIRSKIVDGGASFEVMARHYSEVPSSKVRGNMGNVTRDSVAPEVWATLDQLPEGGVSGIVRLPDRLVLVTSDGHSPGAYRSLAEARSEIKAAIAAQRYSNRKSALVRSLRAESSIEKSWLERHPSRPDAGAPMLPRDVPAGGVVKDGRRKGTTP